MNISVMLVWLATTLSMPLEDVQKTSIVPLSLPIYAMAFCPQGDCSSVGPSVWDGETVFIVEELEEQYATDPGLGGVLVHNITHDVRFRVLYDKDKDKFKAKFELEEQATVGVQRAYVEWVKIRSEAKID